ncbi:MAG: GntR family transcriptional regulator [Anaerolineae bacterium]|nr:GntR family transcriptional regulator [Anaerolineae bacterium]
MRQDVPATIDRSSYEPAYAQLANILRRQIAAGIFRPGDRLPSEAQLCRRYGVSPMTVRRVINILAEQGVVVAEQGRGTFVKPLELGTAAFNLEEFQRIFRDEEQTKVTLLEIRIASADERIAQKLALEVGQRTIYIRRLISHQEAPVLYHREYLIYDPKRPIVEAELEVTSLRGLFNGGGESTLKRGELTIDATVLTKEEAQLLQAPEATAALRLEHIFYDFEDHPVSWGWFICPSDRLRLTTTVGIQE